MHEKSQNLIIAWLLMILAFTAMALVWTRPLHKHLFSGIPYEVGPQPDVEIVRLTPHDCLQLYYKYWLFGESSTGHIPPFSNPYEFALPETRGFTSQQFPVSVLFALFSTMSPIFAYNCIIILSFLACGLIMTKLAHVFTRDLTASFIAGTIFTIMPFRLPQLMAGHPNGVAVFFLPLFVLLAEISARRGKTIPAVLAGFSFSSMAFTDMQLAFFASMLIALYVPCRLVFMWFIETQKNKHIFTARALKWITGMAIGAAPGLIYLAGVKLFILNKSALHSAGGPVHKISPTLHDFLDITVAGERRIYMGPWVILLSLLGLVLPWTTGTFGKNKSKHIIITIFWSAIMIMGLVLSLAHCRPFSTLVPKIPLLGLSRTPARAIVISFVAASILAAYALTCIRKSIASSRKGAIAYIAIWFCCLLLITHDYWLSGPRGINLLPPTSPVYETIVKEKKDARTLAIPVWPGDSAWSAHLLYHITVSKAYLINGYSPVATRSYNENVFQPLQTVNVGQFGYHEWIKASALNISHVTFHPEAFPAPQWVSVFPADLTLMSLKQSPFLEWVTHQDPIDLFRVIDDPPPNNKQPYVISPIGISVPGVYGALENGTIINDPDSIIGKVLTATETNTEPVCAFMNRGRIYPAGQYILALRYKLVPSENIKPLTHTYNSLVLKAVLTESGETLTEQIVSPSQLSESGEYAWIKFPMHIPSAARVKFEAWINNCSVTLDLWHMIFAETENNLLFEAEDMFHVGRVKQQPDASGRGFVHTDKSDPATFIVRGPYRFLAGGDYILETRLLFRNITTCTEPIRVEIAGQLQPDSRKRDMLASHELVPVTEKTNDFITVNTPFHIPQQGAIVEFTLHRPPDITLCIDYFKIITPEIPTSLLVNSSIP